MGSTPILGLIPILVSALLSVVVGVAEDLEPVNSIPFSSLTALIDTDLPHLLVDTRAPAAYENGHIPTAVNIPGYLFDQDSIPGLPADRNTPVITYCEGGLCRIDRHAAERLAKMGFRNAFVYPEGAEGWRQRGQMLVTSCHEQSPPISREDLAALLATRAVFRLCDARSPAEYQAGSLLDAVNLPVDQCRPGGDGMPPSADELVVVFGQGRWDGRAYLVADCLQAWGYQQVRLFTGGINQWSRR